MMNYELREKAKRVLREKGGVDKHLYEQDLESLVEELSIYQIELEHQNEELIKYQLELEQLKDKYSGLFQTAPVGYIIVDDDMKMLELNKTACAILQRAYAELKGKPIRTIIASHYQDNFYFHAKNVMRSGFDTTNTVQFLRAGSRPFYVKLDSNLEEEPGREYMKIAFSDINYEKDLEVKLITEMEKTKEGEKRWQFAIAGSNQGVFDWDIKNNRVFVSDQWKQIHGIPPGGIVDRIEDWRSSKHPDDLEAVMEKLKDHLEGRESIFISDHRILQGGAVRWLHERAKVIKWDSQNNALRLIGTCIDITDRKITERLFIRNQRLSAIGELASGMAHDFNNALQIIYSSTEMALMSETMEDVRDYLNIVRRSSSELGERVGQLQRYSRSKKNVKSVEEIDLAGLIRQAVHQIRKVLSVGKDFLEKKVDIDVAGPDNAMVLGNETDLISVFMNILENSIDALEEGGTVRIRIEENRKTYGITIEDSGQGMTEEVRSKAFQPFFTTKGFEQGRGLGLSLVYMVTKEHKGAVQIKETSPGKGTAIEVSLPKKPVPEKKVPEREDHALPLRMKKVLWVDDEEIIRETGKAMLNSLGQHVDIAANGREALDMLSIFDYDILITDLGMPEMNGWQLLKLIKGKYPGMDRYILTGWGDVEEKETLREHEVKEILSKPIGMEQLKGILLITEKDDERE